MPRCVHHAGCDRLTRQGFDLCDQHYGNDERSPCCNAQIMASIVGYEGGLVDWGQVEEDELFGVCSSCDRVIYEGAKRVLVPVGDFDDHVTPLVSQGRVTALVRPGSLPEPAWDDVD